jgi:hypothetical protein
MVNNLLAATPVARLTYHKRAMPSRRRLCHALQLTVQKIASDLMTAPPSPDIRPAAPADAEAIRGLTRAAYAKWVG